MGLPILDEKIARNYMPQIFAPIKYGENAVFFWFPGAGMTTILRDLFGSKKLLKFGLGKLASQVDITNFQGHLSDQRTFISLLKEMGFSSPEELRKSCELKLEQGYELVYLISRIDNYPEEEKISILKFFTKLSSINPRRIHIIFNTFDKPWFESSLRSNPEFLTLGNRMQIVPVVEGELLSDYVQTRAREFKRDLSSENFHEVEGIYGGIIQLSKEYLRSQGDKKSLDLKLGVIWNSLPKVYKNMIRQKTLNQAFNQGEELDDLKSFGVWDLKLFSLHKQSIRINSRQILLQTLSKREFSLWVYLQKHQGEFISKDEIINILNEQGSEVSLWALDKAISRFREKLGKVGIDPELLKTVKGKGYIWQN